MPLTRISLRRGTSAAYRAAVAESIYQAMRDTFDVPEHDKFMIVTERDQGDFIYGAKYLDIARSDDLIIIQITVSNTRSAEQKKALLHHRAAGGKPRHPPQGRVHQPPRGDQGELVVRQRGGAVCLTRIG